MLDEVNVYLQSQNAMHLEQNYFMIIFLCILEYYNKIFFLTTNMLNDFDTAILDKVQLKLQYDNLNSVVRKIIYLYFFNITNVNINEKKLSKYIEMHFNS